MFLKLKHTELAIFKVTKALTLECYKATLLLQADERFAMVQQIRRAAVSVHLNVAEGCSRKSAGERKRYYEIPRGSVIETDTAFDIAVNLKYCTEENLEALGQKIVSAYKQLSGLIG
jgi:four helix bundle protein